MSVVVFSMLIGHAGFAKDAAKPAPYLKVKTASSDAKASDKKSDKKSVKKTTAISKASTKNSAALPKEDESVRISIGSAGDTTSSASPSEVAATPKSLELKDRRLGVDITVTQVTTNEKKTIAKNGRLVESNELATETVASFKMGDCDTCIAEIKIDNFSDMKDLNKKIDEHIKSEKARIAKETSDKKELDAKIADCTAKDLGEGKILDLTEDKNRKERYSCWSDKVKAAPRDERADMFQTELTDKIQEELLNSKSSSERNKIMASLKGITKSLGYDSELKLQAKFLERGVKDYNDIANIALDSVNNPKDKYGNSVKLNQIGCNYNFSRAVVPRDVNMYCGASSIDPNRYSATTQSYLKDWSDELMPKLQLAMKSPDQIVAEFFENIKVPGSDNSSGSGQNGSGLAARDTRSFDIAQFPVYNTRSNNNANRNGFQNNGGQSNSQQFGNGTQQGQRTGNGFGTRTSSGNNTQFNNGGANQFNNGSQQFNGANNTQFNKNNGGLAQNPFSNFRQ
jgi:hypothetical protein